MKFSKDAQVITLGSTYWTDLEPTYFQDNSHHRYLFNYDGNDILKHIHHDWRNKTQNRVISRILLLKELPRTSVKYSHNGSVLEFFSR
jgi:hypothetical protein